MNDRVIQFRVGVVVVAATIITGIMIMLIGEGKMLIRRQYTVYMLFPHAPGVSVDTPVRKHGVLIGRVSKVEFRDGGGVRLTARIDADRELRRSDELLIKSASLLGDAVVEFVPGIEQGGLVQDQETIADGVVATNPVEVITDLQGNMASAIVAIEAAAREVEQLAQGLNQTFASDDNQIQRLVDKSERAIDKFTATMETIDNFVGDPALRNGLRQAAEELPIVFADARESMESFRNSMAGFDQVTRGAAQNLQNLDDFTRPFGQRGDQLAGDLAATAENLRSISEQFVTFSTALNNREGTLGKLIYDPELYERVNDFVLRAEMASRQIGPIMDDLRVFSDKIATDPRQLGVRGAIERRPSQTGIKRVTW